MESSNGADKPTLDRSYSVLQPLDPTAAGRSLKEAKQILDRLGVVFFLRQGTCLGVIRDNGFIPWDDDLDIGSVIGLHGCTEDSVDQVVAAFRGSGYFVEVERTDYYTSVAMMKSYIRTDWVCHRVVDGSIIHYPGVRIPVHLIDQLKEVDFIGEQFLVPNPPEDYLCFKYGADWTTPKKTGYEKDILELVPENPTFVPTSQNSPSSDTNVTQTAGSRIRVIGHTGEPILDAEVLVTGLGRHRTDNQGYADISLPRGDWYALIIRYGGHEEVLYQERLAQGASYVYRPDPLNESGRLSILLPE